MIGLGAAASFVCSAISSAVSVVGPALGGALSTVGQWIGGVATQVGPIIASNAEKLIGVVAKIPEMDFEKIGKFVGLVADIVNIICKVLGLTDEDNNPEVLGAKAEQAERKHDEFDSTSEYLRYLREKVKLDKERFEKMSAEQRLGCKAIGTALEVNAVEEELGITIPAESLITIGKIQAGAGILLDTKQMIDLITELKELKVENVGEITDYIEGNDEDLVETGDKLESALDNIGLGDKADKIIDAFQSACRNAELINNL